ncbi:3-carboxy-cis,cis-muconate cycloisomerase [Streptomyces sp. CB03234]|uniref:3-carboxy-cis,cis-muconate cycloisomerase n=1 Tax=Streptomyces sp. (strain CB03234) TaxID=1703937 RepID=UPI00093BA526|nr:3-carboxy-cis,cis-muconate cycloisomerase [Streptomyces sp. CB03234]OKJ93469.1 3-carboxy-cis,cis-muconate cycloisomerase [Streptomyces sp. CB03234]
MTYEDAGFLAPGRAGTPAEESTSDAAFLRAMLDAEAALARVQAPSEAAGAITAACAGEFGVRDLALRARSGGNPVIPLVADLTAAVPEHARPYVHRGATSQDILDTAAMLVAARTLALVLADLERTAGALHTLAAAHRDTPMPGRTLTQHAVPTTFGLKAAGWRALVLDARDRVTAVRDRLPAQLGGAAGTLAAFTAYGCDDAPALVAAYARELGLAQPVLPWHTLRTPVADLAGALAFTAGALGKVAADVLTLSRTEIGEVSEGSGGGSSAMPHKANPVRATLLAAAARRAPAHAAVLYGSVAAGDERPAGAWHAEWEPLRDLLRLVGGAAHDAVHLTGNLRVHPARMRANLDLTDGLIVSERLRDRFPKDRLTRAAEEVRTTGKPLADVLGVPPELTDPTHYTGAAAELTDRALERR